MGDFGQTGVLVRVDHDGCRARALAADTNYFVIIRDAIQQRGEVSAKLGVGRFNHAEHCTIVRYVLCPAGVGVGRFSGDDSACINQQLLSQMLGSLPKGLPPWRLKGPRRP